MALIPPALAEITNFSRFCAKMMLEQQRMKATEKVNNAGRLAAFLIEIPSDSRYRLWAGARLVSIIVWSGTFTSFWMAFQEATLRSFTRVAVAGLLRSVRQVG